MIEGNPEHESSLRVMASNIGQNSEHSISLLGPEDKDGVIFHRVGTGSSVYPELAPYDRSQVSRIILPMHTLDGTMRGRQVRPPVLLKLDVQGFELEVLRGGAATLTHSEMVIMETSLLAYNENAPLFADVIAFMAERGFVAFDFCGQARRQSDFALFQTDVAFARKDSALRTNRDFWIAWP